MNHLHEPKIAKEMRHSNPASQSNFQFWHLPESIALALPLPILDSTHILAVKLDEKCR